MTRRVRCRYRRHAGPASLAALTFVRAAVRRHRVEIVDAHVLAPLPDGFAPLQRRVVTTLAVSPRIAMVVANGFDASATRCRM